MKITSHVYLLILVPFLINGGEQPYSHGTRVHSRALIGASQLGRIVVRCYDDGFTVKDGEGVHLVERGDTDTTLRKIIPNNLFRYTQKNKIQVSRTKDGKYILRSHIDGIGGGPMFGAFAYWATKSLCWGTVAAGAGAAVATGVGAVAGAIGGGVAVVTGGAIGTVAGTAATTAVITAGTTVATGGAAAVATVVAGGAAAVVGGTEVLVVGTAATVACTASAGGATVGAMGGIWGFIEVVSTLVGAAATAVPFIP